MKRAAATLAPRAANLITAALDFTLLMAWLVLVFLMCATPNQ